MLSYVPNHSIQQNYKSDQITMNCIDLTLKRSKMLCYVPNHSKHRKTTKVIKLRWIASIWRQNDKKMLSYVPNHSKHSKTTKVIKLRWIGSIWRQNDQKCWVTTQTIPNTAKLQKWSNYDELDRFDVKTIKNVELRPKPFKTTQTYKSNQIAMNCIDLMSKTSNNAKLQKWSNYDEVHGLDVKTNKNVELRRKPFKTTQIYKGYQSTMNCIDLMSKRTKMMSYVGNHSKQRKSTKVFKLRWIASIWCQKHQTTQNYKSDQITRKCMDLTSKRTKMLSYVPNHSKQRKSTKFIKVQWIASIWCQNDQKCWVTSQTIPNTAKLQKWSNYDEVHGFDVKTNKNVELVANHSKQRKSTKVIKVQWIASIWCQNDKKCWVTFQTIRYSKTTKVIKLRWIASIWR